MSITQRILEGAQSQWSKLTSLVIVDEEPLSHIDGPSLQAELAARKNARAESPQKPTDNPIARISGAGEAARAAREKAATARRIRVNKERDERAARQKVAADEAYRRMQEEARRTGGTGGGGAGFGGGSAGRSGGAQGSTSSGRPPRPGSSEAQLLEWHKTLDVPLGADLAQIKSAYRKLMRKYHPDMHAGNPQKEKAATELSLRVTTAYDGLVSHLEKK